MYLLLLLVAGSVFVAHAAMGFSRLKRVKNTYRSRIKTASQGLVEVEGYVWPLDNTLTNIQGEDCIYHSLQLMKFHPLSGKSRLLFSETRCLGFVLVDDSGAVEVQPSLKHSIEKPKDMFPIFGALASGHPLGLLLQLALFFVLLPMRYALFFIPWRELFRNFQEKSQREEIVANKAMKRGWFRLSREQRSHLAERLASHGIKLPLGGLLGLPFVYYRVVERSISIGRPAYVNGYLEASDRKRESQDPELQKFIAEIRTLRPAKIGAQGVSLNHARSQKVALESISFAGRILQHKEHPLLIYDEHETSLIANRTSLYQKQLVSGFACITLALSLPFLTQKHLVEPSRPKAIKSINESSAKAPGEAEKTGGSYEIKISEDLFSAPKEPTKMSSLWSIAIADDSYLYMDMKKQVPYFALTPDIIGGRNSWIRPYPELSRPHQGVHLVGIKRNSQAQSVVDVWNVRDKRRTHRFWIKGASQARILENSAGSFLAVLKFYDGNSMQLQIWNLANSRQVLANDFSSRRFQPSLYASPTGKWVALAYARQSQRFESDTVVALLDPSQESLPAMPHFHAQGMSDIRQIVFNEEKNQFAIDGGGTMQIVSAPDLKFLSEIRDPTSDSSLLSYLPESQLILFWSGNSLVAFDPVQKNEVFRFPLGKLEKRERVSFAFSDNGKWLVAEGSQGIWRWDLLKPSQGPQIVHEYKSLERIARNDQRRHINISDDGQWVAEGNLLIHLPSKKQVYVKFPKELIAKAQRRLTESVRPTDCKTFGPGCIQAADRYKELGDKRGELSWRTGACLGGEETACRDLLERRDQFQLNESQLSNLTRQICVITGGKDCENQGDMNSRQPASGN